MGEFTDTHLLLWSYIWFGMDERIHGDKTLGGFSNWHADDVDCDIWLLSMRET